MRTPRDADLMIVGGGPAGLSLAAALADALVRILAVERCSLPELETPRFDGREVALTRASERRLRQLGIWVGSRSETETPERGEGQGEKTQSPVAAVHVPASGGNIHGGLPFQLLGAEMA